MALVALLPAGVAVVTRDEPSPLESARAALDDDEQFLGAETAGLALLRVSRFLTEGGERCADEHEQRPTARCSAFFAGAGHTQVISVLVLSCSRPEIFDVRASLRAYLDELASEPEAASLPPVPRCA